MGGDGGSIPGRADVVRTAGFKFVRNLGGMGYRPNTQVRAGSESYGPTEARRLKWTTCAISQEPLKPPLSVCRRGLIYNRERLIERLLNAKTTPLPVTLSHIRRYRRDVRDAVVEFEYSTGHLVCPVLKVEFDAGVRGVLLWSCGCIVSEKALQHLTEGFMADRVAKRQRLLVDECKRDKAVADSTQLSHSDDPGRVGNCPICSKPFQKSDIVDLIPDDPLTASQATVADRLNESSFSGLPPKPSCSQSSCSTVAPQSSCPIVTTRESSCSIVTKREYSCSIVTKRESSCSIVTSPESLRSAVAPESSGSAQAASLCETLRYQKISPSITTSNKKASTTKVRSDLRGDEQTSDKHQLFSTAKPSASTGFQSSPFSAPRYPNRESASVTKMDHRLSSDSREGAVAPPLPTSSSSSPSKAACKGRVKLTAS